MNTILLLGTKPFERDWRVFPANAIWLDIPCMWQNQEDASQQVVLCSAGQMPCAEDVHVRVFARRQNCWRRATHTPDKLPQLTVR